MLMNLKEGDHYVVNRGEGLMTFDFDDDISMTEEGAGMAGSWCGTGQTQQNGWSISCRWTTEWRIDRVGADLRGRRRRCCRAATADRRISPSERMTTVRAGREDGVVSGPNGWRRPFVTHFMECQPYSNDHNIGWEGMQRALHFADDQVLRNYGFRHAYPLSDDVLLLSFNYPSTACWFTVMTKKKGLLKWH
ncbi:hypothetical protein BHE74_00046939 [Ensete ventricosum]|nr:hypothetical protein GW17_00055027 [Ensete ventricosum]RWW47098.1 hypothetical protein BHE74_00046939 [Ensete ventricosum]